MSDPVFKGSSGLTDIEIDSLSHHASKYFSDQDQDRAMWSRAIYEVRRYKALRGFLKKFGRVYHHWNCKIFSESDGTCDCGFDGLLAYIQEDE